jgi:hypothetical protein
MRSAVPSSAVSRHRTFRKRSEGRVTTSTTYQIHDLAPDQYPHFFDLLRDWWQRTTTAFSTILATVLLICTCQVENNQNGPQSKDDGELFIVVSALAYGRTTTPNYLPDGPIDWLSWLPTVRKQS